MSRHTCPEIFKNEILIVSAFEIITFLQHVRVTKIHMVK